MQGTVILSIFNQQQKVYTTLFQSKINIILKHYYVNSGETLKITSKRNNSSYWTKMTINLI